MSKTSQRVENLALDRIVLNPDALRQVEQAREDYIQLRDSVAVHGVIQPILVRPAPDGSDKFMLVDGAHRYTASKDLGLPTILACIADIDDIDAYEKQMITNLHQVRTKPAEYAKHLERMLTRNPMLTIPELARKINMSPAWLHARLRLNKLTEELKALVDDDKVVVTNAQNLAALPEAEQNDWVSDAMTMPPDEFKAKVDARLKEIRSAKREGRDPDAKQDFVAVPKLRKIGELKEAVENSGLISAIIGDATDPVIAGRNAILWAIRLDESSVNEQKSKDDERKARLEDAKLEARAKRAAAREKEAATAKAEILSKASERGVQINLDT